MYILSSADVNSGDNNYNTTMIEDINATMFNITTTMNISSNNTLSDWGPKRDPLYIVIPITIIYILIFFTGLIGNISTCIVIFRNRSMHTATNFYLFSLAISDLLLLSGLPHEMYSVWSKYPYLFGETFCVLQGLAAETSANATVLTITAFTVERYVAICHPFLSHTLSRLSRAVRLVIVLWITALCLAIPQALEFGVIYEQHFPEHTVCAIKRKLLPHAFEVSTLLFFIFPMTLITVLYVLIGIRLHKSSSTAVARSTTFTSNGLTVNTTITNNSTNNLTTTSTNDHNSLRDSRKNISRNSQNRATKHVVKMLVAVVAAFFICWAPFHAQRLLAIHGYNGESETSQNIIAIYNVLTYVSGVLYYLSTTVNPVLYHIMSNKFRDAFKDTLARCVGKKRGLRHGRRRLYSGLSRPDDISSTCCREESYLSTTTLAPPNITSRRANSLRYLEADVARQGHRPLVVSFRRPHQQNNNNNNINGNSTSLTNNGNNDVRVYVSVEAGGRHRPAAYLSVLYRSPSEATRATSCPIHDNTSRQCYCHL